MLVAHEAADRQLDKSEHLAVLHGHLAAALDERLGSKRHVLVVVADHEQVMRVVAHGLGERAMHAKARAEAIGVRALGTVMAVEHGHLERVDLGVCLELAVDHGYIDDDVLGDGGATHAADGAHATSAVGTVDRDLEVGSREVAADMHGVGHKVGPLVELMVEERAAVLGHEVAVDVDALGHKAVEIGQDHEIGALARGDGAHVRIDTEHLCCVDGGELQRRHRVAAALMHAGAERAVHAALGDERIGMVIVGAKGDQARVDAGLEHLRQVAWERQPRRAVAGLNVHAHTQLGDDVLGRDALVARAHAGGDVGVEAAVLLRDGVVAGHALAGLEGLGDLADRVLLAAEDAGEVHHLAEAHDVVPVHGLGHLRGIDVGAAVVKARDGRHARGRGEHVLERGALGVVEHGAHTLHAGDVAALVRVGEDRGGAARHHDARVLGAADHGGLNMDMRINVAGRHVLASGVDDLGSLTDAVLGGVLADAEIGHAPAGDGDIGVLEDLVRGHAHEIGVADNKVGRTLALGDLDELGVALPERRLAEIIDHRGSPLAWRNIFTIMRPPHAF